MDQDLNNPIDRLTKIVVQSGGISDEDAERISSSPFMHARLRARIEAESRHGAEQGNGWLGALLVASRAIAVLAIVTIAAVMSFWLSKANASVGVPQGNAGGEDISRVVTGGTCALSTTQECAISTEEVLATMFAEKGAEEPR